jgi:glutamyl-tRNA reductase
VPAIPVSHVEPTEPFVPSRDASASPPRGSAPLRLAGLEFSLETGSLDALEATARSMDLERVHDWFDRFEGTEEVAVLATCHRIELVLLVRSAEEVDRWASAVPGPPESWRRFHDRSAVRHLFRVAAGLESLARGEAEVRHQVRAAGRRVESRHPRPVLRELFAHAADAAHELAPEVPPSRSIAAVAAARVLELHRSPRPRVLVIGSGTVGRQLAELLAPAARVTLVFHENPPEPSYLCRVGARAAPLSQLAAELRDAEAVVTAAKFGARGVRAGDLPRDRPILLVDLGMPRNIDPEVRALPNVRLIDLAELRSRPLSAVDGADARVEERADQYFDRMERRLLEPWIDQLRRVAEAARTAELAHARRFLGRLDPEQERALERLTRRIVDRLLLAPTERLRALPPGPDGDRRRRQAVELLSPSARDP